MTKMERFISLFNQNPKIFRCPRCEKPISVNGNSLVCEKGHCFDIAKKGYVNFFGGGDKIYGKELFDNRRAVFEAGFFTPMLDLVSDMLGKQGLLLDAGSGEGYALDYICRKNNLHGIGVDLAAEGVKKAGCYDGLWLVSDISRLPLRENAVDYVINILSPASYNEFKRVMKSGATVVKVFPGENHLIELRRHLGLYNKNEDGKEAVFEEHFPRFRRVSITYKFGIDRRETLEKIVRMTPLTNNRHDAFKTFATDTVTADFTVFTGN